MAIDAIILMLKLDQNIRFKVEKQMLSTYDPGTKYCIQIYNSLLSLAASMQVDGVIATI